MFLRAVLDAAHPFNRPLVMDVDIKPHARVGHRRLFGRVIMIIVGPVFQRRVIGQAMFFQPLFPHQILIHRFLKAGEHRVPIASIVINRHVPLGDRHFTRHWNADRFGEDLIGDTHMGMAVVKPAQRGDLQAKIGFLDFDVRSWIFAQKLRHRDVGVGCLVAELPAVSFRRIFVLKKPMQERGVRRIYADFQGL